VYNLTRAYAARELPGFGRAHDYPPQRFYTEPVPTGATEGMLVTREQIEALLDDYYALRGWDNRGLPTAAQLRKLGLSDVAEELAALGRIS
jgi:aldehyde:ferredoxin oxidoreductase